MTAATRVSGIVLSNPDKALWPDAGDGRPVTKLELARYFEAAAPWLLGHVCGRPCAVVRAPDGIRRTQFFQRHAAKGMPPEIGILHLPGERKPWLSLDSVEALVAAAQLGVIELHPPNGRPGRAGEPDRLVFDLDPGPGVKFDAIVAGAWEIRDRLAARGLASFCKTTGGKGLHVVAPLSRPRSRAATWASASAFSRALCTDMAADSPARYVVNPRKDARDGKVFLDYLRNAPKATAVAPLSPRARPGARVSMPLRWDEVTGSLDPAQFTVRTALAHLAASRAWRDYARAASPLPRMRQPKTGPAVRPGSGSKRTRTRVLPRRSAGGIG